MGISDEPRFRPTGNSPCSSFRLRARTVEKFVARRWIGVACLCSIAAVGCGEPRGARETPAPEGQRASAASPSGLIGARIPDWVPADDGQWTQPAKDYANTRYSSLD